MSSLNC